MSESNYEKRDDGTAIRDGVIVQYRGQVEDAPFVDPNDPWIELKLNSLGDRPLWALKSELARRGKFDNLTPEERMARSHKGGANAAIAHKRAKTMREIGNAILKSNAIDEKTKKKLRSLGIPEEDINYAAAIFYKQVELAVQEGQTRSAEFTRDTTLGKPGVGVDINATAAGDVSITFVVRGEDPEDE